MSYTKIYDKHTLFVKCGFATAKQLRSMFEEGLRQYNQQNNTNIQCTFYINLVQNREGVSLGIAFVFVSNSSIYYMLIGKNSDGTDRIEYIDDPDWKSPEENIPEIHDKVYPPGISWSEAEAIDELYDKQILENKKKFACPQIAIVQEPLIILPSYELTDEQAQERYNAASAEYKASCAELPRICNLIIDRAMAPELEDIYMPNILKSKGVPKGISKEIIKSLFKPFVTDSITKYKRNIKGKSTYDSYPFVNITSNGIVFVTFDPSTNDAHFALYMMKKVVFFDNKPNKVTLIFSNSYRSDRDLNSDQHSYYNKTRSSQKYK